MQTQDPFNPNLFEGYYEDPWEKYQADEHLRYFLDPENIKKARKSADDRLNQLAKTKGFTEEHLNQLRWTCKHDLFTLNKLLGYTKLSENLHGHFCSWYTRNRRFRFKLVLLPRGHYKSTVDTITESIQSALPDPEGLEAWPNCLGTNIRICLLHEKAEQASKFLTSVTGHFLSNPLLIGLYPECVPTRGVQKVNLTELELPRTSIWSEATFTAMGLGSMSQGYHGNKFKLDDLIGKAARESATVMQSAKDWLDNLQSFFSDFDKDVFDLIGTRWSLDDIYNHMMEMYGLFDKSKNPDGQLLAYIRRAEEPDRQTGELVPIFPEGGFNKKTLAILKKNPLVYAAQYSNDPSSSLTEFSPSWKKFYTKLTKYHIQVATPVGLQILDIRQLDICFLYDPAKTGNCGFLITAGDGVRVFVLEAHQERWSPPQFVNFLFQKVQEYQPRVVSIESVLFQELYKYWLYREMQVRKIYFPIYMYDVQNQKKELRVRALATPLMNGLIYYHRDQKELIRQHDGFGAVVEYHLLDALAQGIRVWSTPFTKAKIEEYKEMEEAYLSSRDPITGY